MKKSKIEWTELVWNPTTGCDKISQGCKFCYAEVMANRLHAMGIEKYKNNFKLTLHEDELNKPYQWKKPSIVFVNSMSDLFHEKIPIEFIRKVFQVMKDNKQHTFQILTKRAGILQEYDSRGLLEWADNIWAGVSVESNETKYRIDMLRKVKAKTKFISFEPLLEAITDLDLTGIDWVIVGGESGRKPRPMKEEWVIDIKNKCIDAKVKFFFKQWGGTNKNKTGRQLQGRTWDEMPEIKIIKGGRNGNDNN